MTLNLHNYGYHPTALFHTRSNVGTVVPTELTFGVEDEVSQGMFSSRENRDETIDAVHGIVGESLYMKSDASIGYGFEMVTHPFSLAYHTYMFSWKHVLKTCRKAGFTGEANGLCGLHIHIGRQQLGETEAERKLVAARIMLLVEHHWDNLITFSRRRSDQLSWCAKSNLSNYVGNRTEAEIAAKADSMFRRNNPAYHSDRYRAVNLMPTKTVEIRLFNSTTDRDTLIAALQLCNNLAKYAMRHSVAECLRSSWADIIHTEDFRELNAYVASRGL